MTLRQRLAEPRVLLAPGVYDAFTALLAEQAGFEALYLSGASIAYTRLGRSDIGSLETGKLADLIAVDLSQPETQPLYHPLSQLVYACNGSQVSHSWIGGVAVMEARQLTQIDLGALAARTGAWRDRIRRAD